MVSAIEQAIDLSDAGNTFQMLEELSGLIDKLHLHRPNDEISNQVAIEYFDLTHRLNILSLALGRKLSQEGNQVLTISEVLYHTRNPLVSAPTNEDHDLIQKNALELSKMYKTSELDELILKAKEYISNIYMNMPHTDENLNEMFKYWQFCLNLEDAKEIIQNHRRK